MAHLWVQERTPDRGAAWAVLPLEASGLDLGCDPPRPLHATSVSGADDSQTLLLPSNKGDAARWICLAGARASVQVNGTSLPAGIRVLADQDEIRVGGRPFYFSRETLARVEPFPGADSPPFCPRCKLKLLPPDASQSGLAVRCPRCGIWHHERDDSPCWTYAEVCALCLQRTALDAGFEWTPEEL